MNNTILMYHHQFPIYDTRYKRNYHHGDALYDCKGVKEVV